MIGFIYSFVKSAVVFSVLLCVCAAGTVCVCLFTPATLDLALRLVGMGILLSGVYALSATYAFRLFWAEIDRVGGDECDCEKLGERLRKIAKRTLFGSVRGAVLLQYAYTRIYCGAYREAMETVSDAIIAGKTRAKGEAAVCFCEIFYLQGDADYFGKYYDKACQTLDERARTKIERDRAVANARRAAIAAMQLHLRGEPAAALARLRDFVPENVPALQRKNLAALCEKIMAQ